MWAGSDGDGDGCRVSRSEGGVWGFGYQVAGGRLPVTRHPIPVTC